MGLFGKKKLKVRDLPVGAAELADGLRHTMRGWLSEGYDCLLDYEPTETDDESGENLGITMGPDTIDDCQEAYLATLAFQVVWVEQLAAAKGYLTAETWEVFAPLLFKQLAPLSKAKSFFDDAWCFWSAAAREDAGDAMKKFGWFLANQYYGDDWEEGTPQQDVDAILTLVGKLTVLIVEQTRAFTAAVFGDKRTYRYHSGQWQHLASLDRFDCGGEPSAPAGIDLLTPLPREHFGTSKDAKSTAPPPIDQGSPRPTVRPHGPTPGPQPPTDRNEENGHLSIKGHHLQLVAGRAKGETVATGFCENRAGQIEVSFLSGQTDARCPLCRAKISLPESATS